MCVLLVAFQDHPHFQLVVAANRDEFYDRPAAAAAFWPDQPRILAGRDLERGGTWLGIDTAGRFAAVTNIRGATPVVSGRSRGLLVSDFLGGALPPADYAAALAQDADAYAGVNLLLGDRSRLLWWSNRARIPRALRAGTYGLSNDELDSAWPKVERLKREFAKLEATQGDALVAALFALLRDDVRAADAALPDTGVGLDAERLLSAIFINAAHYGTRCSTVILRDHAGATRFVERRYLRGEITGESRFAVTAPEARG